MTTQQMLFPDGSPRNRHGRAGKHAVAQDPDACLGLFPGIPPLSKVDRDRLRYDLESARPRHMRAPRPVREAVKRLLDGPPDPKLPDGSSPLAESTARAPDSAPWATRNPTKRKDGQ